MTMHTLTTLPARLHAQRTRLTMLALLLAALYFVLAFAGQALRARELQADIDIHEATLAAMVAENGALEAQVQRYATDAYYTYVEQRARRDLLLAYPGETLVLIDWQPAPPANVEAPVVETAPETPNWRRWLEVFDRR